MGGEAFTAMTRRDEAKWLIRLRTALLLLFDIPCFLTIGCLDRRLFTIAWSQCWRKAWDGQRHLGVWRDCDA